MYYQFTNSLDRERAPRPRRTGSLLWLLKLLSSLAHYSPRPQNPVPARLLSDTHDAGSKYPQPVSRCHRFIPYNLTPTTNLS